MPRLVDILQICAALDVALAGFVGLIVSGPTARRIAENAALWATIRAVAGMVSSFVFRAATRLNGGHPRRGIHAEPVSASVE
jgi:hypothetical protein